MDARKRLAQRLNINSSNRGMSTVRSSNDTRLNDQRKRLPSLPLAARLETSFRSKKTIRLDPISPYIRGKVTGRMPASFLESNPSPIEEPAPRLAARSVAKRVLEKEKKMVHGETGKPFPDANSPFDILHLIKFDPNLAEDFWYLNRKDEPYEFEFVPYKKKKEDDYLTISSRGVTYFKDGYTEFLSLEEWDREFRLYQKIKEIPFFKRYKKWKNFSMWKKTRRFNMMHETAEFLDSSIFFLDHILREPLLDLRAQAYRLMKTDLVDMNTEYARPIQQFKTDQLTRFDKILVQLEEIEQTSKDLIVSSCRRSMEEFHEVSRTTMHHEMEDNSDMFLIGDSTNKKMPHTQRAIIKIQQLKLVKYITLCDYMVIDSKLEQAVHSSRRVLESILHHEEAIEQYGLESRKIPNPLLLIECTFEGLDLVYFPTLKEIKEVFDMSLKQGIDNVCRRDMLITQSEFNEYLASLEDELEEGPDLVFIAQHNQELEEVEIAIKDALTRAFSNIVDYSSIFEPFMQMYKTNEETDFEIFRECELEDTKATIENYKTQSAELGNFKEMQNIGIFQLDTKKFKDKIRPSPRRCLQKLEALLPELSDQRSSALLKDLNDANRSLVNTPKTVEEYIQYNKFLRSTEARMSEFSSRFSDCKDLNQLIEHYEITLEETVKQKFTECLQALASLRQRTEMAIERDSGDKIKFVKELKDKISVNEKTAQQMVEQLKDDRISDRESQPGMVVLYLRSLGDTIEKTYNNSKDFTYFEDELELERTNFENIADMRRDYKLKNDMWSALYEWGSKVQEWYKTPFKNINVDQISKEVENYFRIAMRSRVLEEQGNYVPEVLRAKVEELRNTMPVVADLRSPALLDRHWELIKSLVSQDINIERSSFTLKSLIDLKVNNKKDDIAEIALKAKKEQELERQLQEIQKSWENVEFPLKYNKEKDVYTLTQIEELISMLDDTHVAITAIMTNRFVAPIYEKVEPWQKKFSLLSSTLDEWLNVQKQWLHLENIFQSPDIAKQLPTEQKRFNAIDSAFRKLMKEVSERPNALKMVDSQDRFKELKDYNGRLEQIEKALEEYLDKKRKIFPRFYFLSNDELLEILAQSRVPTAIQPHLRKIFESIYTLEFNEARAEEIVAMKSAEGERVQLSKNLRARDNVEDWLKNVEADMAKSLKREMKEAFHAYEDTARKDWILIHIAQVVSALGNVMWTFGTEEALSNRDEVEESIAEWLETILSQLEELTQMVRTPLSNIHRRSVVALVTQEVHNRDIIESLKTLQVSSANDFRWQQQLRYYFSPETEECRIKQVNSVLNYGYEYMGATTRLVITPLTDRCWITITGALHIKLGASPAGPAGTGKTESVKDLAKAVGQYCVVFNCSEQITYMMMEKLFLGLCNSGAWSCLDEFNRIDVEVLSVIAQQLRTIRNARWEERTEFLLGEKHSLLKDTMGVFITMNPGYAGRAELPDNLKVLFRPVSMMVPDYTLIAEIMLFAEGFSEAKRLSGKMTKLYKLSSEQLSQQDHYDFGMRAVKSVLNMAGALKRRDPDLAEEVVLIRAMRDSNVPKFLNEDLLLFHAIVQDLFPGVEVPYVDYGELADAVRTVVVQQGLQPEPRFIEKVIQLFETFAVRFGAMLVGRATSGKTACYRALAGALDWLRAARSRNQAYQEVEFQVLNPKAITMGELYGEYNAMTQDWKDGLASSIMRDYSESETSRYKWVVFDGPVDSLWIENMNTVLDDNMMLCLANGQRIKLKSQMRMLFEVQDLAVASPATVSRCGMVYMTQEAVGWRNFVQSWVYATLDHWPEGAQETLLQLFDKHTDRGLAIIRRQLREPIPTLDLSLVAGVCSLLQALTVPEECPRLRDEPEQFRRFMEKLFVFAFIWGLGGALDYHSAVRFESQMSSEFSCDLPRGSLYDSYVSDDMPGGQFKSWDRIKPEFAYTQGMSYFSMVVPTRDTVRYSHLLSALTRINKPVFLTGPTGVGKTVIASETLNGLKERGSVFPVLLTFSAQTSSVQVQNSLSSKLDAKKKDLLGAPGGKKAVVLIDDVNMPSVEEFGAQPPIELLRQLCDLGYIYDRTKHFPMRIMDTTFVCCAAPPEGGRHELTPRFTRHFSIFCMPPTSEESMTLIFRTILDNFFGNFKLEIQALASSIVYATLNLYHAISTQLLPTPAKTHYTFNLRDVSKVFQGLLMSDSRIVSSQDAMIRLWVHETSRVFMDRLVNEHDRSWFSHEVVRLVLQTFRKDWTHEEVFEGFPILFGDFLRGIDVEERFYEEATDPRKINETMNRLLNDYNYLGTYAKMELVFFRDALQHLFRVCRIIRQPRGNAMLIGVGGCGKQSLTRLATFICNSICFQIQVTKSYGVQEFREDLKTLFKQAGGVDELSTIFLLNDTQIVKEAFLEDINNILNSGEVPNLFTKEELEEIEGDLRNSEAAKKGVDNMYNFFIDRVRENLHVVLCLSPVGDSLRVRMRMFPSLVNCCTIDWVEPWPADALYNVGISRLQSIELEDMKREDAEKMRISLAETCVAVHTSILEASAEFYETLSRRVYITPKSYLDMISMYAQLMDLKYQELSKKKTKYRRGVETIVKTNELVSKMQEDLIKLKPIIAQKQKEAEELEVVLERDSEEARRAKDIVEAEQREVGAQTAEVESVQKDAKADLDQALPALDAATRALEQINQRDIAEIRTFPQPAPLIRYTLEAVSILLRERTDWDSIKRTLQASFIDRLKNFARDEIPKKVLVALRKKIADNPDFTADKVGAVNVASKSLCLWVYAMDTYAKVSEEVAPKRQRLEQLNSILADAKRKLERAQSKLEAEEARVASLEARRNAVVAERDRLDREAAVTETRLSRASILTVGLAEENERWKEQVVLLSEQIQSVVGDAFLAAACISYYGPFTGPFRARLVAGWLEKCLALGIPVSPAFELRSIMADPMTIRDWNIKSLPADSVSVDNGVLVTCCERWPLLIDPQEQASKWIKQLAGKDLRACKQTDRDFARALENSLRNGMKLLVEDVGEVLHPALEPVLNRNFIDQGAGQLALRIGEQEIDFDPSFRLYLCSKMPNPHYLPDVAIKTTIINFTVTAEGLEEQLLVDVVKKELPAAERKKSEVMLAMAKDQKSLLQTEDNILTNLSESSGNILDNAKIIETLQASKKLASEIQRRMRVAEQNKQEVEEAFRRYQAVSVRGRILYFVLADLAIIDPMYQYSLGYFSRLFNSVIEVAPRSNQVEERVQALITAATEFVFSNVCRGLFNAHKLIFSFVIALQILRNAGSVTEAEVNLLLRGVSLTNTEASANPLPGVLTEKAWQALAALRAISEPFESLDFADPDVIDCWTAWVSSPEPQDIDFPLELSPFHRLLLIKCCREEKLIYMTTQFVEATLGRKFVQPPPASMDDIFQDTNSRSPIIFILSQGADPNSMMLRFAEEKGFSDKFEVVSLGKGQGDRARRLVESCSKHGHWLLLQNCHLAQSWMPELLALVESFEDPKAPINEDFRLFLTSMPFEHFPVPVLQNGLKLTNEPPKGLKANLLRSLHNLTEDEFETSARPNDWKKLLTSLCFFHAVVQERRKFGPLGWNILYEFNEADLETSILMLRNFLDTADAVPWDALKFMTGEINYGGRVTDDWDRRCLMRVLDRFFDPEVLSSSHNFSASGVYRVPSVDTLQRVKDYTENLPLADKPEIFGLHENADLAFQQQESSLILSTVVAIQPRETGKRAEGLSPDEVVEQLAQTIEEALPKRLLRSEASSSTFERNEDGLMDSLATFLGQEMVRFNHLLEIMEKSLGELQKAIKGQVVMSAELDAMYQRMLNNQVPLNWEKAAYPSLRPLGSWVEDLKQRVIFLRKWLTLGKPDAFWLSAFFFPQGFLTAVLQSYSRRYQIPIDILGFSFDFQTFCDPNEAQDTSEDGCYIYGLYMEGTRWDMDSMQLEDSRPGEIHTLGPVIFFSPAENYQSEPEEYAMPVYKTSLRAGVLSTTGHSTNFIIAIDCPSTKPPAYWVLQGAAFLCQLND